MAFHYLIDFEWRRGTALRLSVLLILLVSAFAQEIYAPGEDICNLAQDIGTTPRTYYIEYPSQLAQIRNCTIFSRGIALSQRLELASWVDNTTSSNEIVLDLGAITHIRGKLEIRSARLPLKTIRAPNLVQIDYGLMVSGLAVLEEINMGTLRSVGQNLSTAEYSFLLSSLPSLQRVQFASEDVGIFFHKSGGGVLIENTGLRTIDFLKTDSTVGNGEYFSGVPFTVQSNHQLNEISLPGVTTGLSSLTISNNEANLTVSIPNLESASSVLINNVKALDLPGLLEADTLELFNTTMETVTLEKLRRIRESLAIRSNRLLTSLTVNSLTTIGSKPVLNNEIRWPDGGDLKIDDNPQLRRIHLDDLEKVGTSVRISGPFDRLPDRIADVLRSADPKKELYLNSTDRSFDCTDIDKRVAAFWTDTKSFPKNTTYTCITMDEDGNDVSPKDPPVTYRAPMSSKTKQTIIYGTIGAVLGVVVIAWSVWAHKRRKRLQAARAQAAAERGDNGSVELDDVAVASVYDGHARRREAGEQPPQYTRTGKPGEVPPVYVREVPSSSNINQDTRTRSGVRSQSSVVSDATTAVPEANTGIVDDTTREAR